MQTRWVASLVAGACGLAGTTACAGALRAVGMGSLAPMDSAQAVAVAERNVCGHVMPSNDSTCVVIEVNHRDGPYVVTLDRHPPAGNDRVNVTLTGANSVEVAQVPRPRGH